MREHALQTAPESPVPKPVGWREVLAREHLPRLLVLCLAIWLHAANTMLAATTLPVAVGDIGGLRFISWAFALYLAGSIVAATAISASVARHGLHRTMLISTLLYTVGCVICASAPTMAVLLAGRTAQGLGGGALVALVYIAQDRFFPNRLVPRVVALLSVVWMASSLSGPLIGGAFATAGLWRAAFWSFALQGLLLAAAVGPLLARAGSDAVLPVRQVPVVRLVLVAVAIVAISSAGAVDSAISAGALLLSGCVCLALFVARDSVREDRDRAGSLLPSAQQAGFALGAALTGIIAGGLGFEQATQTDEYRTAAFWLFAGFVPPALLGNVIAWRFGSRIARERREAALRG